MPGGLDFRVVRVDGRGNHHHIGTFDILDSVSLKYGAAQLFEAVGNIGAFYIRARHLVAQIQQQFGDSAHADTTDADKMNMVFFQIHSLSTSKIYNYSMVFVTE